MWTEVVLRGFSPVRCGRKRTDVNGSGTPPWRLASKVMAAREYFGLEGMDRRGDGEAWIIGSMGRMLAETGWKPVRAISLVLICSFLSAAWRSFRAGQRSRQFRNSRNERDRQPGPIISQDRRYRVDPRQRISLLEPYCFKQHNESTVNYPFCLKYYFVCFLRTAARFSDLVCA